MNLSQKHTLDTGSLIIQQGIKNVDGMIMQRGRWCERMAMVVNKSDSLVWLFFPLWSNRASLALLLAKVLHLVFFIILCNPLIHLLLQIIQTIYNLKFTVTTSEEESIINFASFVVVVVVQFLTIKVARKSTKKACSFFSPTFGWIVAGFF